MVISSSGEKLMNISYLTKASLITIFLAHATYAAEKLPNIVLEAGRIVADKDRTIADQARTIREQELVIARLERVIARLTGHAGRRIAPYPKPRTSE